jgi:UDP-glucuronate 4-epimerase
MNILVTGGAGFIGSHLVEKLLSENHEVVCLDNFDDYYNPKIKQENIRGLIGNKNYTLIEGDIRDVSVLNRCFHEKKIDAVVHLAARAGVRPSIQQPELYYDVNVIGTLRLIEAMKIAGVKKLVFASSSSVYGDNPKVPFSEFDSVDNPISPYAATKKASELICHTYHHLYNFDIFCLRFFTVYGPRQRPEMAIHQFTNHVFSGIPITLFGDGSTKRDYTYIDDIVTAVMAAIERVEGYEIINVGGSRTVALIDLVRLIEKYSGNEAIIEYKPEQAGDVKQTYAEISKAERILNYSPQTTIEDGIEKFITWYRSQL